MGRVIDYPDAPQGEVLRYDFGFYGKDYGLVNIRERTGPASLDSMGLIHSDRLLFCFTYLARMIYNLGKHEAATQLILHLKERPSGLDSVIDMDDFYYDFYFTYDVGSETGVFKQRRIGETGGAKKPRKTWGATLTRQKGGALVCQPKVSLFGDVAAMSISSTLVLFDRTFRLATPAWRDMFLVGLGAMIYFYEKYDHSKSEFISVVPSAAWDAINAALESSSGETVEPT